MEKTTMTGAYGPGIAPGQAANKSAHVRSVFENVPRYVISRLVDIKIRVETVSDWTAALKRCRTLDIGCGTGAISLPLLSSSTHLTLLDLSENMLAAAQAGIPESLARNVEIRNENFMSACFDPGSFDLIICLGVLAHVESPDKLISKIAEVLRPGGSVILALTDSRHLVGRLVHLAGRIKEIVAPARYPINVLSFSHLVQMLNRHQITVVSSFRYAAIPPGIEKLLPSNALYRMVRLVFGRGARNRNAWLGNEYICLLTTNQSDSH